jgi:hypothetical protein
MCSKYASHSTLNSQHDWGILYDRLMSTRNLHFDNETDFHMSSRNCEVNDYMHEFGFANRLISYKKWVQREEKKEVSI